MAKTMDMTVGNPARLILTFCLPIAAGNLLQQFYNLVDTLVIGRGVGVVALAAVSGAGWLDWTVLSIAMGLAQGFAIQIAQSFGAGNHRELQRAVGQSILLAVATIFLLEIASQAALMPVLRLLAFPENTIHLTALYLRIIFGGLPLIMGFNLLSGFLQSVGDSRTPLIALVVATVVNILLDVTCVIVLRWDVAGAAIATTASQAVSFLICLRAVIHLPLLHPTAQDMRPDHHMIHRLLSLGIPVAFQNLIISIGGLVLQRVVNGFGFIFMAGYNAASRLQGMLELCGTAIGAGVGTFAGQNLGAGKLERVREGLRKSAVITVCVSLCITLCMFLFGRQLLALFVDDDPQIVDQVLTYGHLLLLVLSSALWGLYLLFVHRSTLQGLGDTFIPMLSGVVELVMRITCALLLPRLIGEWGVYFAEIAAWLGAAALLIWGYHHRMHILERAQTPPSAS